MGLRAKPHPSCRVVIAGRIRASGHVSSFLVLIFVSAFTVQNAAAEIRNIPDNVHNTEDTLRFSAIAGMTHDSNLFRFSGQEEALATTGDSTMSDTLRYYGAGVVADMPVSRQRFRLEGNTRKIEYNHFDFLDHTSGEGTAQWFWQLGRQWEGDLGYAYQRAISSFEEERRFERDIRTHRRVNFSAGYLFHPDWSVQVGINAARLTYEDDQRNELNRDTNGAEFELRYLNAAMTYIGGRLRIRDTQFPERDFQPGESVDDAYRNYDLSLTARLEPVQGSYLNGYIGYTAREYANLDDQNFYGLTTRLSYQWPLTGKTQMAVSIWRHLDPVDDLVVDHVVQQGIGLEPQWMLSDKVVLKGGLLFENRDYEGLVAGRGRREDDVHTAQLSMIYAPILSLAFIVLAEHEQRTSSFDDAEYEYNTISSGIRFAF